MTRVTAEQLAEWKALADAATPGPWTIEKPGMHPTLGFADGIIIAAVARGMGIYAKPPTGSYPANDRAFIADTREAIPALVAEVERLREALRRLGSCEAFKGARALDQDRDEELLARIDFARAALEDGT